MTIDKNTNGYLSSHYFCDRVEETELLTKQKSIYHST